MHKTWPAIAILLTGLIGGAGSKAAEQTQPDLIAQARRAYQQGKAKEAIALATEAIKADAKNPQKYFFRARLFELAGQYEEAIGDYTRILELEPGSADAIQSRGSAHFQAGHIEDSIKDFDEYIRLAPERAPHHWQRGISYYYAGRYADGQRQFELHQTVNADDVENAVWHYLCVARLQGPEKARASIIKVGPDARVPMKEIWDLFAGKGSADLVMKAAQAGAPPKERLRERLFYAHLYLGLYHEAQGEKEKSLEHIKRAAEEFKSAHYMGSVARVHYDLRKKETEKAK